MLLESLDAVMLARIQFAFTVGFHILFPTLNIGLAWYLALLEWRWLKTKDVRHLQQFKYWVKIFALAFGLGVVSGIVMAYQFGTNFSRFIQLGGNVLGPLLAYEVLTAFFLEAGFLGVMLFGMNKVGPKMHFFATAMVAIGTTISAFWILSANSWMQTPTGFIVGENGVLFKDSWMEIIFNPSLPYRFSHKILASLLTTSFVLAGISAWYLLKKKHQKFAQYMFSTALWGALIFAPLQLVVGDLHGLNTLEHQPIKVAAMEGLWDTQQGADLLLFAWPDEAAESNKYEVRIDNMASYVLTHDMSGEVQGLKSVPKEERPPVAPVFFSFRVMVLIGMWFIALSAVGLLLRARKSLYDNRLFLKAMMWSAPLGFVATIAGWFVTEIGRQPYVVYGLLKTADAVSPVGAGQVALSLLAFIVVYSILFVVFLYYLFKLIRQGPTELGRAPKLEPETTFGHVSYIPKKGGKK